MKYKWNTYAGAMSITCLAITMCLVPNRLAAQDNSDPLPSGEAVTASRIEEAFPGRTGEHRKRLFETPYGTVELEYQVIDGQSVFQGDILLPPEQEGSGEKGSRTAAGVSALGDRWPHGIVYYENSGLANDPRVVRAIREWTNKTSLRFVPGATSGNRIRFVTGKGCRSAIGRQGGRQDVELATDCDAGNAMHEIGHAIGMFHEHTRTDRANFVIVNDGTRGTTNCILPANKSDFKMFGADGLNLGAYEIASIMHYPSDAFVDKSKKGCTATITRLDGTTFGFNRVALTNGDIAGAQSLYLAWTLVRRPVGYTIFGPAIPAYWRPSSGYWHIRNSNGSDRTTKWGEQTDIPVPGDYDNDFIADLAVWRPSTGLWYVTPSRPGAAPYGIAWGQQGDVPVPGDYNGDRRSDFAVWRPSTGEWRVLTNGGTAPGWIQKWGSPGDVPVPGDYDGDGRTDLAVWRPSTGQWFVIPSHTGNAYGIPWGQAGDVPVPADYDGDGRTDMAVWRPTDGRWYFINSSSGNGFQAGWGERGDVPVPGDYTGDHRTDFTVWRPSDGKWYVLNPITWIPTVIKWGVLGDVPLP